MPLTRKLASFALTLTLSIAAPARATTRDDAPTFADRPDEDFRNSDRAFGFLLDPLAMAIGVFGGEADFVLGRHAAFAVQGDVYRRNDGLGVVMGAGMLIYPLGSVLHELYMQPRIAYAHPWREWNANVDWSADAIGVGGTAGWQWTWDYGLSVRVGGGAMYFFGGSPLPQENATRIIGLQLVLDGSLGWAF